MPKRKQRAKTKPSKNGKIQKGALEHEETKVNREDEGISPDEAIELLEEARKAMYMKPPRDQIALLKPLAECLESGLYDLAMAESLIDDRCEVSDINEFNNHMYNAQIQIEIMRLANNHIQLFQKYSKFTEGCTHDRLDNLGKAIKKAWETWVKDMGTKPTARNVYDCMEVKGNILEKEEDDNGNPIAIHWKRPKRKEVRTPYHTFENRLTGLKKKGILPPSKASI